MEEARCETKKAHNVGKRIEGQKDGLTLLAVPENVLPTITVRIGDHTMRAVIDTAAASNFIDAQYFPSIRSTNIPPEHGVKKTERNPRTVPLAAEGHSLTVYGDMTILTQIDEYVEPISYKVAQDLRVEAILGLPWLIQQQVNIDFQQGRIHFGVDRRYTCYWAKSQATTKAPSAEELDHGFKGDHARTFQNLVENFPQILTGNSRTKSTSHKIRMKTDKPICVPQYKTLNKEKRQKIQEMVEEMLRDGVIAPSNSPYNSPALLLKKGNGGWRFCIDYRSLNDAMETEPTTMPLIADALRDLGDARIFSSLDLQSGYWQVPMDPASKKYTAFSTPDGGHYHFNVMPFGLKNAPATFQKLMSQQVLKGYIGDFCLVYLDDVIVFSKNVEDHLRHLALVFERLQEHNLHLSVPKCEFGKTAVKFLGHNVVKDTIEPLPKHLKQIEEMPRPKNRKEVRKFLGTCNWLRDYVPRFSHMATPLTDLLSPRRPFKWTVDQEIALQAIKTAFRQPLALQRPTADLPYVLQTDASGIGIAAVLYQVGEDGQRRILNFASARLNATERRYHINEQECLAIVWAIRRFRPLLEGRQFTIRTDSKALTWLQTIKDTKAKLIRWALLLQEFDFTIEHCSGEDNQLPDLLSRNPEDNEVEDLEEERIKAPGEGGLFTIPPTTITEEIANSQKTDEQTRILLHRLRTRQPDYEDYFLERDGLLYVKRREDAKPLLYVPTQLRRRVLHHYHDEAGHPGQDETIRAMNQRCCWEQRDAEVRKYVRSCMECAAYKASRARPPAALKPRITRSPWHTVSVDLMGPYPTTNKKQSNILVVTDVFTKWTEAFPIGDPKAPNIIRIIEKEVFYRFGYPSVILTDNGPQFTGARWTRACKRWGTTPMYTGVYHPRANPVERRNQELKKGLRIRLKNLPHTRWADQLPIVLRDLRCRRNAATGYTPGKALLGYEIRLPGDQHLDAEPPQAPAHADREIRLQEIHEHQLTYARRYAGEDTPDPLEVGDQVMIRNHPQSNKEKKLHGGFHPKWLGPYAIRELHSGRVYTVERDGTTVRVPSFDVKRAPSPRE